MFQWECTQSKKGPFHFICLWVTQLSLSLSFSVHCTCFQMTSQALFIPASLHFQLKEIPNEFFVDIVSHNNFLTANLQVWLKVDEIRSFCRLSDRLFCRSSSATWPSPRQLTPPWSDVDCSFATTSQENTSGTSLQSPMRMHPLWWKLNRNRLVVYLVCYVIMTLFLKCLWNKIFSPHYSPVIAYVTFSMVTSAVATISYVTRVCGAVLWCMGPVLVWQVLVAMACGRDLLVASLTAMLNGWSWP